MLSTINGIDLLLVFTIIGIGYYASIQSDNADIATAKLETMRLASVEDSHEYNAMCKYVDAQRKQSFEIIRENRSLTSEITNLSQQLEITDKQHKEFASFIDHTNQWQELDVYAKELWTRLSGDTILDETHGDEVYDYDRSWDEPTFDPWAVPPQTEPTYCEPDCTGSDHLTRPCF